MYEKIAWNNFLKTGDIQSFLEYRKLMELNKNVNINNMSSLEGIDGLGQNIGEDISEFNKSQGDSNKRDTL